MSPLRKNNMGFYSQPLHHQLKLRIFVLIIFSLTLTTPVSSEDGITVEQNSTQSINANTISTTEDNSDLPIEEDTDEVAKALDDLLQSMQLGEFEYKAEERADPFTPFISDKILNTEGTDSETGERLTGMRQFEPGQLNLVAIIFTESNPMAMLEDSSHRGYMVRRGTKIGKTGIVTDITPNQVIIKQLTYSMDQATKYSTIEMILRKEGEK